MANALALCGRTTEALRVVRALKARGAALSELLEHDVLEPSEVHSRIHHPALDPRLEIRCIDAPYWPSWP